MATNLIQELSGTAVFARRSERKAVIASYAVIAVVVAFAVFAPLAAFSPTEMDLGATSAAPSLSSGHLFGTDALGRDVFSRAMWGARPPILIALASVALGMFLGVTLGTLAGYTGRWLDQLIGRLADIQVSIPGLVLALVFLALFGTKAINVVAIIAIESWPMYFRVVRSQVLSIRTRGYVEAAKLMGVSTPRLLVRHVLPNSYAVLIVAITINFTGAVLAESSLSFLGLGIQPPTPDWGVMIAEGQSQLGSSWWISLAPGALLVLLLLAFQIIADDFSARHALKDVVTEGVA